MGTMVGGVKGEPACKPGSVEDNHSSGTCVTAGLKQPTRKRHGPRHCFPIWSCSRRGLPSRSMLPPARCALTAPFHPYLTGLATRPGGILSVALSVGSRPPGITWHPALWSPDFPPRSTCMPQSDCLASSRRHFRSSGRGLIVKPAPPPPVGQSSPARSISPYTSWRLTSATRAAILAAWLAGRCSRRASASLSATASCASTSTVAPPTTRTNSPFC